MSNLRQEIRFPGTGLNTDDSQLYMKNGDAPYRLHIMVAHDGQNGVIENMKGNHLCSYPLTLSRAYLVGGSYYDRLTRKCYYLVFSQPYDSTTSGDYLYDNHLLCFNEDTEVITNIFTDTKNYFGIDFNYVVKDWDMIGDWLYFNPRVSEPKMINVTMAKNFMDYDDYDPLLTYVLGNQVKYYGGVFVANAAVAAGQTPCTHTTLWDRIGDAYIDESDIGFDSEFRYAFNVIRHIPVYRPICSYGSDSTRSSNNVQGKVFQFTHRYKYYDNTHSKWSAYSDLTLPQNGELYNGEIQDSTITNNYINVKVQLHSPALVKELDVAFRIVGESVWKRAKVINRREQATLDDVEYTYTFYNTDSAYEILPDSMFSEPFDSVPRWTQAQELINKNVLTYGGVTEGFDNIPKDEIDVTLTPEMIAISQTPSVSATVRDNILGGDISYDIYEDGFSPAYDYWQTIIDLSPTFLAGVAAGNVYTITLEGTTHTYTLSAADVVSVATLASAIAEFIYQFYANMYSGLQSWATVAGLVYIERYGGHPEVTVSFFYTTLANEIEVTKHRGFKTGAWHPFCIYYYDKALRRCDAQTSKENEDGPGYTIYGTTVYIPGFNETSPLPTDTANKWNIDWEIAHPPPEYAKWWRWGYAGNALCSYFVQYTVNDIADEDTAWTTIDITPLQTLTDPASMAPAPEWTEFPQSNIDPYQFVKGDRIRFITNTPAGTDLGEITDGLYDYEIVKLDDTTTPGTTLLYVQQFDYAGAGLGEDTLVEIYRPRVTDVNTIFYEFGELYPIKEDSAGNRVHGGAAQDQDIDADLPATGTFSNGDVYHIARTPSKPIDPANPTEMYFHESQWYSDFYDSSDWDKGRPGVETWYGERTLNIVRYSDPYFQNTLINGLSTFQAKNYKELNDIYGTIQAMVEVGNTLKVYMQKKSASILIGRQEYTDTSGNTVTVTSERILGSVRYPENNLGTQWIESVCKNNKFVYGYDAYTGVVWRDSVNGIFPVSGRFEDAYGNGDYKMETYFRNKAIALNASGLDYVRVMTGWDEKYDCLYVIFRDIVNDENDDTIVFHEPSNRWITFADFTKTYEDGYNVILELDWWVTKGFELGINFEWDEDIRFAIFNIVTGSNAIAFPSSTGDSIEIESADITVITDETRTEGADTLRIGDSEFSTICAYVAITESGLDAWTAAQYGWDQRKSSAIASFPSTITLSSAPAWIKVTDNSGNEIGVGVTGALDTSASGSINVYPKEDNLETVARSGTVVFTNSYGDTDSLNVSQDAALIPPTLSVYVEYGALMVITDTDASSVAGDQVTLVFTPTGFLKADGSSYYIGEPFTVFWRGYVGGVDAGNGSIACHYGWSDVYAITLSETAQSGDAVVISLREETVLDKTLSMGDDSIVINDSALAAVVGYSVSFDESGFNFLATASGFADAQDAELTARPIAAEIEIAFIPRKPNGDTWIRIADNLGNVYEEGDAIYDGYTIYVYPYDENTSAEVLSGTILFETAFGDVAELIVTQAAADAPPGEVIVTGTVSLMSGSEYDGVTLSGSISGYSTQSVMYAYFEINYPTYEEYEPYPVYVKVLVNGENRTFGEIYEGIYYSDVMNGSNSFTIPLDPSFTLSDGDVVVAYFAVSMSHF